MRPRARKLLGAGLAVAGALFAVLHWVLVPYRVSGPSMEPTLLDSGHGDRAVGDIVLVSRLAYLTGGAERWDVAVIQHEGQENVKRVVGLPGETLEIRDGNLLVNNAVIQLPAPLRIRTLVSKGAFGRGPVQLGKDEYFLLGDGGYLSRDSRVWGPIRSEFLRGKVIAVVWPWPRLGFVR